MKRTVLLSTLGASVLAGVLLAGPVKAETCNPDPIVGSTAHACGSLTYPTDGAGTPTGPPTSGYIIVSGGVPQGGVIGVRGNDQPSITVAGQGNAVNPAPFDGATSVTVDQGGPHLS